MQKNKDNKAEADSQEAFLPKTRGSEARCEMSYCSDEGGSHWPIFLVSFSAHRFAIIAVTPCNVRSLLLFSLERTLLTLCSHYKTNVKQHDLDVRF